MKWLLALGVFAILALVYFLLVAVTEDEDEG